MSRTMAAADTAEPQMGGMGAAPEPNELWSGGDWPCFHRYLGMGSLMLWPLYAPLLGKLLLKNNRKI